MVFADALKIVSQAIYASMDVFTTLISAVGANRTYMYMIVVFLAFSMIVVPMVGGRVTLGSDIAQRALKSDKAKKDKERFSYVDRRGTNNGSDVPYRFGTGGK